MADPSEFEDELRRVFAERGEDWQQKIMILPQPPPLLWWARHLDDGDRAEFLSEIAVAAGAADLDALERCLEEWQRTAAALADPAVREILTAEVIYPADFAEVQRPEPRRWLYHVDGPCPVPKDDGTCGCAEARAAGGG